MFSKYFLQLFFFFFLKMFLFIIFFSHKFYSLSFILKTLFFVSKSSFSNLFHKSFFSHFYFFFLEKKDLLWLINSSSVEVPSMIFRPDRGTRKKKSRTTERLEALPISAAIAVVPDFWLPRTINGSFSTEQTKLRMPIWTLRPLRFHFLTTLIFSIFYCIHPTM